MEPYDSASFAGMGRLWPFTDRPEMHKDGKKIIKDNSYFNKVRGCTVLRAEKVQSNKSLTVCYRQ